MRLSPRPRGDWQKYYYDELPHAKPPFANPPVWAVIPILLRRLPATPSRLCLFNNKRPNGVTLPSRQKNQQLVATVMRRSRPKNGVTSWKM